MAINDAWLAQIREVAIDPELPICDPHHHLWDGRERRVERRYLMDEIQKDLQSGYNVVSTVFIKNLAMYRADGPAEMEYIGKVEFASGVAAMADSGLYGKTRIAAGVVGYAELATGASVKAVLEAEIAATPDRFRGIRCTGAWDPDPRIARASAPGLYLDAKFRRGFAELEALELSFDLPCRYHQIPECADLARAFPGTTIVLNNLGGITGVGAYAGIRGEIFSQWRSSMTDLARCPNVVVKLGGLATVYAGFGWHERPGPPTSHE